MQYELYEKYKATDYQDLPAINPLSFILRKAELGYWLTELEWDWLTQRQLTETQSIIKDQENYRDTLCKKTKISNELYKKYNVKGYKDLPALHPLSIILRKAELGHDLIATEWNVLDQHQLSATKEIINNRENFKASQCKEIDYELLQLQKNQFVYSSIARVPTIHSKTALILYKINARERLANSELLLVGQVYHRFLDFNDKKQKYNIIEDIPFDANAEAILEKLEQQVSFYASDIKWLCTYDANSFLTPLENQFSHLQDKYKAIVQNGFNANRLKLFHILQKLDEETLPNDAEINFLKQNRFIETLEIMQKKEFSTLKVKYFAMQIQEDDITQHLFKVLKKLDAGLPLLESDINYLKKRKLSETVKFAYKKETDILIKKIQQNDDLTSDDVVWCEQHDFKELIFKWLGKKEGSLNRKIEQGHDLSPEDIAWCKEYKFEVIIFYWLKHKYGIKNRPDTLNSPLYAILKKLHADNRLTDADVVWLVAEKWLRPSDDDWFKYRLNKVYIAHHALEAQFYENEFQRTKDHWKLASASAHWRKAVNPQQALKQTNALNFKQIKPAKLAAALLTTRGGALRDVGRLDEAEQCALEAIEYFPDSHNPYTLMGALCYDTRRYDEGYMWFDEAVKRGAKPQDQDAEIKRILYKKKDLERQELINHLLKKDPYRFAWLKTWKAGK